MEREGRMITVIVRVRAVQCGPFRLVSAKRKQLLQVRSGKKATDLSIGAAVPAEQRSRLQAGAV